ncbi:MAG: hypothetical protein AABW81_01195 [Nanoarchaeota archaeon]
MSRQKNITGKKNSKIEIILARQFFFLPMLSSCIVCVDEGLHTDECNEFVYFNQKNYEIHFECENNPKHSFKESYTWKNKKGMYHNMFDHFLYNYFDMMFNVNISDTIH